jgi:hypothetical protein
MNFENITGGKEGNIAPRLDVDSLPWVECSCGGRLFDSAVMVKRVSPLLSPTAKEEIIPADIIICRTCGKIPDFYAKKIKGIPQDLISTSE